MFARSGYSHVRPPHVEVRVGLYNAGMSSEVGEIREELIDLARDHGYSVSTAQLARWHREGLLPRPRQRSLGKGHGTQTVYPPGTGKQLLALCAIHASERRLRYVAWRMWWAGFDVSSKTIRAFIGRWAAKWDGYVQDLIDPSTGELSESALRSLDSIRNARYDYGPLAGAQKRVGRKRLDPVMSVLFKVVSGVFEGYSVDPVEKNPEKDEQRVAERSLELDWLGSRVAENTELGSSGGSAGLLKELSRFFLDRPLGEGLATLTDEQLVQARDEARRDLAFWQGTYASLGLGETSSATEPPDQALCLLLWSISRFEGPVDLQKGLEAHAEPTPEMRAELRDWEALAPLLERLRTEVPAFTDVLAPQRMMGAFLDPQETERHAAELRELIERHADELKAFFKAHPEAGQALGVSIPEDGK